jgi:hypothetical protein
LEDLGIKERIIVKIDHIEIGWEEVDWIEMIRGRIK